MVLRPALFALLALLTTPHGSEIDRLIKELGSDDLEIRERATDALAARGEEARAALEAVRNSPDQDLSERARWILRQISPLQIVFDFDPCRADSRKPLNVSFRMVNRSDEDAFFFPGALWIRVQVLEFFEDPLWRGACFGRQGVRPRKCALEESHFARVAPRCGVRRLMGDLRDKPLEAGPQFREPAGLWTPTTPGRYRVLAHYQFSPEAYRKSCPNGCAGHADPLKPWNRCPAQVLETERDFVITKSDERCDCGRH